MKYNNYLSPVFFFKNAILITLISLFSFKARAQSNIDRIKDLYSMLQNARVADMQSPNWLETKRTIISGDCQNGYGILMVYGTQQEGYFRNGQLVKGVVTTNRNIVAHDDDIYITRESGLDKISNLYGLGFTLEEINYFQNLAFKNLTKVQVLTEVNDHVSYYNTTTFENHKAVGYDPQWRTTTIFYKENGLRNNSDKPIIVRLYSKQRSKLSTPNVIAFDYLDKSVIIWPGADIAWGDMAVNPPPDNRQNVSAQKLDYEMTREQAFKAGYGEYTRYVGEYTDVERKDGSSPNSTTSVPILPITPAPVPDAVATTGELKTITVDSYTKKTDIIIRKGDKITISASGSIVLGPFVGSGGPDGVNGYERYRIVRSARHGALVYRIGNDAWDTAGTQRSFTAQSSGNLQLMVNDSDPSNNRGSFTVKIEVTSPN